MCGLVGAVGSLEHKHKIVLKEMIFLNTLRGKDSTGLSVVTRKREVTTRKFAIPGYEFIEIPQAINIMSHDDQLWMAHNRAKTMGEVSRANAHPFEVLDENGDVWLVGTHNGTLENKYEIERSLPRNFGTDSEALFNLLVEEENFKAAINKLRGAWSLVFWDPTSNSLHFCRNEKRPMTFAWTKDKKVLFWASEAWMIVNACRRNGIDLLVNERGVACYTTSENYLYTLKIPQKSGEELPDLEKEGGYSGAPKSTFHTGRGVYTGQGWWDQYSDEEGEEKTSESKKETKTNGKKDDKKVIHIGHPSTFDYHSHRGFEGALISNKDLKAITSKGCSWCSSEIKQAFAWLDKENVVCFDCIHDLHPKDGGRVHSTKDDDPFDDELPEDLAPQSQNSKEYKKLIDSAVGAVKKAIG